MALPVHGNPDGSHDSPSLFGFSSSSSFSTLPPLSSSTSSSQSGTGFGCLPSTNSSFRFTIQSKPRRHLTSRARTRSAPSSRSSTPELPKPSCPPKNVQTSGEDTKAEITRTEQVKEYASFFVII
ncbi:unnamed protein product [Ilex paraguariensis]|uniref:Uncharacterized protein n=1 Tax=Ilex paraguariensis TaxID=185542 RepID=A0ABC8TZU5_9AQUA